MGVRRNRVVIFSKGSTGASGICTLSSSGRVARTDLIRVMGTELSSSAADGSIPRASPTAWGLDQFAWITTLSSSRKVAGSSRSSIPVIPAGPPPSRPGIGSDEQPVTVPAPTSAAAPISARLVSAMFPMGEG